MEFLTKSGLEAAQKIYDNFLDEVVYTGLFVTEHIYGHYPNQPKEGLHVTTWERSTPLAFKDFIKMCSAQLKNVTLYPLGYGDNGKTDGLSIQISRKGRYAGYFGDEPCHMTLSYTSCVDGSNPVNTKFIPFEDFHKGWKSRKRVTVTDIRSGESGDSCTRPKWIPERMIAKLFAVKSDGALIPVSFYGKEIFKIYNSNIEIKERRKKEEERKNIEAAHKRIEEERYEALVRAREQVECVKLTGEFSYVGSYLDYLYDEHNIYQLNGEYYEHVVPDGEYQCSNLDTNEIWVDKLTQKETEEALEFLRKEEEKFKSL